MGTWNTKPFGNDTACDWLWTLEKAKDESVLQAALEADADGDETIAAAAVIESARREPIGKLPPEAKAWVSEHGFVPSDALVTQAMSAVEKIKTQSELRELWTESKSLNNWLKQIDSLLAGLREGLSKPAPERKPKAPAPPRSIEKMIEKISPNEESPLRERLHQKLESLADVNALIEGAVGKRPLNLLAAQGLIPEAKRLLERGAQINPRIGNPLIDSTPLEDACANGQAEMAEWLLTNGAEIAIKRTLIAPVNGVRCEPKTYITLRALGRAVRSGSIATVELLLQHRNLLTTDFEEAFRDHPFLHNVVDANHPHLMEHLVKRGFDIDVRNRVGMTPLSWAAIAASDKDRKEMVEMLLALGANPNTKDNDGLTPLDVVPDSKPDVAELIKKYGGRSGKEISD